MKKKILIIGYGANAYALAKKLSEVHEIYITPGSAALKEFATCLDIRENNLKELLEFVVENGIDMTIPLSNEAINADIATTFANNKQPVFAPTAKASEIIRIKSYAKKVFYKLRIPTPKFGIFEKQNAAVDYLKNQKLPFVIKTNSPMSATIVTSTAIAKNIIDYHFIDKDNKIIIEDYIYGTSFAFYAITDGYKALPIGSSVTYKYALEGNGGQLTKGMGAHIPNNKLTVDDEYFLMDNIIYPLLDYLDISGNPYLGIIGVNGIISDDGKITVLDLSSCLQDSDVAAILDNIQEDLYTLFESCIIGSFSDEINNILLNNNSYVSVVLECKNKDNTENVISGLELIDEDAILTFYPSVTKNKYLEFEANNGAVCAITCASSTISGASKKVKENIDCITFNSKAFRQDICKTIQ